MTYAVWPKSILAPLFQRVKAVECQRTYTPNDKPPPRSFRHQEHPLEQEVTKEVDAWFLNNWPFENEQARKKYAAAAFPVVTCNYYPLASKERVTLACQLLTILFLMDGKSRFHNTSTTKLVLMPSVTDMLEEMSLEEGKKYNDDLMAIIRGDKAANRAVPDEWMMWDLWEAMRACDRPLADDLLEPTFEFMRAQTDKVRLNLTSLGQYLLYREEDVGIALLCSLQRFSMGVHLTPAQLKSVELMEKNASKHISVVNDIYSFNKELRQNAASKQEGSVLCTAVKVVADECALSYDAAKRVLWPMCREWELVHQRLEAERKREGEYTEDVAQCVKGLELLMSGNERWSETTPRYHGWQQFS